MDLVQVVTPRLDLKVKEGWCLKFVQDSFRAPVMHPSATVAANATKYRFSSRKMPDVAVPVWFDHWAIYQGKYANWGHVVIWVPGRGFLSSPPSGFGSTWLSSIEDVERVFFAKYRFWSLDINTLQVAKLVEEVPEQEEDDDMWKPTVHVRLAVRTAPAEYMVAHPEIGKGLKAGESKKEGEVAVFKGYMVSLNPSVGTAWARTYAKGAGSETSRTDRAGYIAIQQEATRMAVQVVGA